MRRLISTTKNTRVLSLDEKETNGTNNHYAVIHTFKNDSTTGFCEEHLADVSFQKGTVEENGVNGCTNADLLSIVIDRLEAIKSDGFVASDTNIALRCAESALYWAKEVEKKLQNRD